MPAPPRSKDTACYSNDDTGDRKDHSTGQGGTIGCGSWCPRTVARGRGWSTTYPRAGVARQAGDSVVAAYPVSGTRYDQLDTGTYQVFSRSRHATSWHGTESMEFMVRFHRGARANIGFHDIPVDIDRRRGTDAGGAGHAAVRRLCSVRTSSMPRRCGSSRRWGTSVVVSTLTTASPTPTVHWSLSLSPEPRPGCAGGCGFAADGATSRSRGWCPRRSLRAPSGPAVPDGHHRCGSGPCPHRVSARSGGDRSPRGLPPPRPRARHAYAPAPAADRLFRAGCRGRGTGAHWTE